MNDLLAKDRKLQAEMQDILAVAKSEKRHLTDEEQSRFNALREEREVIAMEMEANRQLRFDDIPKQALEKRFAELTTEAVTRGGQTQMEVRDVLTEASINDSQVGIQLQSIIKPLQERIILNEVGLKVVNATAGDPVWSRQGTITASVLGENEETPLSELNFEALTAKPKRISVSVPVSRRAITRSNYDLYSIVTEAMGDACARKLNSVLLSRTAVGEYEGPFVNVASGNSLSGGIDWTDVLNLESAVMSHNVEVDKSTTAYVVGTPIYSKLKATVLETGDSKMVLDVDSRVLNGYKLIVTNATEDGVAYFGDFSQCGICYYGGASFIVDPYTLARKNIVLFTLNMDADIVTFHKEAFAYSSL